MKKSAKAAIATGAAAVLLLGSAGTLAYWNDTATLSGQNAITAGDLQLTTTGTPTWKIQHTNGTESTVSNIASVRLVPGDKLTYSFPASIKAQGQNLRFKVGLTGDSITLPANPTAADKALADQLELSAEFDVAGATKVSGQTNTFEHKKNVATSYVTTITATITWPFNEPAAKDNLAVTGQVNLSNFSINVTQVDGSL
ncbi:alternate-type signal peptide domain-containing protein [Leucobacter insecticola]|uniref:Alternate-type signal peptide domain-containing protein n=1 Tax=Leucobacter insecticola TaxID=2714934 RepID=A0A6G8FKB5_9MICO|nr:alternate-type signal peptide domain-containing protein [Leucobacter insecticola]QIM16801.1 alternate-type signal peptide domain-containing protein [Leucobacter insecticola]